jgi:hypothetical protein
LSQVEIIDLCRDERTMAQIEIECGDKFIPLDAGSSDQVEIRQT